MKKWIYSLSFLTGTLIATMLLRWFAPATSLENRPADDTSLHRKSRHEQSNNQTIQRLLAAESMAMKEQTDLMAATKLLASERKSPLRTRSFLKARIQWMTLDRLNQALMNGDVQTRTEIDEIFRRLTAADPRGTFNNLVSFQYQLRGMENSYTAIDAVQQTWADADAPALMARLQEMPRGGSQQDMSLRFSNYWATTDPAAAASHFDELVYLRNMQDTGGMIFTDNEYASKIVTSWQKTNEAAMRDYITHLPVGRQKAAMENALSKIEKAH